MTGPPLLLSCATHNWKGKKEIKGLQWEKRRKLQSSVVQRKVDINDRIGFV